MASTRPTRLPLPLILVRGFGGLGVEDEKRIAYQGFNDGTVYPRKLGENYIYEGLILRLMKSNWRYHDATNVVGYYPEPAQKQDLGDFFARIEKMQAAGLFKDKPAGIPEKFRQLQEKGFFHGDRVVIDPAMALNLLMSAADPLRTLWVFRYYDLDRRQFIEYGKALVRLIDFIRELAVQAGQEEHPKVNLIAHSMGGLLVREAVQGTYPSENRQAAEHINKIVTLGTPHRGISFQVLRNWVAVIKAEEELEHFNPDFQKDLREPASYLHFAEHFPPERLLTVVGTNYRSYAIQPSSWLNRLFSVEDEFGANYNRSDGLVKQTSAQIPNAPRTFVHKCHGGVDSLVTSREAYEVAARFFYGNYRARLRLVSAEITRGKDLFGKSEFFLGVSIKPRRVDFDLFHQSAEAENCYGPFSATDLSDPDPAFAWAGADRLIWEGWLDTTPIEEDPSINPKDMVLRLDFYLGERDLFGIGFSDNVIFRKQYYVRALLGSTVKFYLHAGEEFALPIFDLARARPAAARGGPGAFEFTDNASGFQAVFWEMTEANGGWEFDVTGTGFRGRFRVEVDQVPPEGLPTPWRNPST